MILSGNSIQHHKHANIPRLTSGAYGRNELAILGAPCNIIRQLAQQIIQDIASRWKIAYLDADHASDESGADPMQAAGASTVFTNKITYQQVNYTQPELHFFQKKALFNGEDLLLINGNHFTGSHQIIIIDPAKPLEKKLDRLTQVQLILLKDESTVLPDYVKAYLPGALSVPTLYLHDTAAIADFIQSFLQQRIPPLHGLVLTGGKSQRMGTDKSEINYHGLPQKQHVYQMLTPLCRQVFISVNEQQQNQQLPVLTDRFTGLGPMGGILTALQSNPNTAWLVLACDLPFLTTSTLRFLIQHRNPSKIATAFFEPNGTFPEPLITIWEPRSYQVLLQALGQGYTCPRKVLINSDVEMLTAPNAKEFENVNDRDAYNNAKSTLQITKA